MSVRYEVRRCRTCPDVLGMHWTVTPPTGDTVAATTRERAMEVVARMEVTRLGRGWWAWRGEPLTGRVYLRRGDGDEMLFPSWAEAARFLAAWVAAHPRAIV